MATDTSDIAKQGYVRVRSRNIGVWQRRWLVLRRAAGRTPCRLEKYLEERHARLHAGQKVVLLGPAASVCRLPASVKRHAFALAFQDGSVKAIACDSDLEADTWVKLMVQECLEPQSGLCAGEPDILSPGIQKELQEQFHVHLVPSPKLEVFGECLLQVTHEHVYLWDLLSPRTKLAAWPLTALRRYGSDPAKFTFEAGRHCATGEGMFVFHTLEGEKIYSKVHQATLAIAEAHHRSKRLQPLPSAPPQALVHAAGTTSAPLPYRSSTSPLQQFGSSEVLVDHERGASFCAGLATSLRDLATTSCSLDDILHPLVTTAVERRGTSRCSLRSHLLQFQGR
ncbi:docking protein 5 [Ixodes scapularis]|uniref:Putative downstream of tyrosine kinase 4 n=1 Tax=Ixodes ricinus TaxID=34613 RepID=A0A131Y4B9_IXORI|nr:docking protein 5 [Ixodes scapularis]